MGITSSVNETPWRTHANPTDAYSMQWAYLQQDDDYDSGPKNIPHSVNAQDPENSTFLLEPLL